MTEKKTNVALIGMSGAYKTTVGKLLAQRTHHMAVDTDEYFEFERGLSIAEFVSRFGMELFRAQERKIVSSCAAMDNVVISTGGGVVLDESNMKNLSKNSVIVYLYATPLTLFNRVKNSVNRPLLNPNTLETMSELFAARAELYEKYADFKINTNRLTSQKVADRVYELLKSNELI